MATRTVASVTTFNETVDMLAAHRIGVLPVPNPRSARGRYIRVRPTKLRRGRETRGRGRRR
ncbi:hypothetical protein Val02_49640 [Virgisporangium aliadipatigenens]|uniref:Uncharacterized protein n=1 Tax=Virgisporangium aliadipatigenens TaxID=741659 RepID=A0A8J3YPS1_9ACTN|nr:hypothetical protein Val02_49640 [Virgisporangium aliadipatigenens]